MHVVSAAAEPIVPAGSRQPPCRNRYPFRAVFRWMETPAVAEAAITSLKALRAAEAACTRCPLYQNATQVVPGEGPARARLMMVGEQPGDQEDRKGHPFVGPAGGVLAKALEEAGIEREEVFVTNAVKHFKF